VEIDPDGGYRLAVAGRDLLRALAPLQAWATRWARSR
jgi:DNA-binding HxlR family transcriptional regulator